MYRVIENGVQFKGFTRYLSCNSEGKAKRISDYPFGTASFGDTRGLISFVKKHSYPNAEVEKTIGNLHDNKTYKIYVTDPNEIVNNIIKLQHDYVVYDYEPAYPNIKEGFFNENIKKDFDSLKNYLKQLEIVIVKSLQSSPLMLKEKLEDVKRRILITEECAKVYEEASALIEQNANYERKIRVRNAGITTTEELLPKYKEELEKVESRITNHQIALSQREALLDKLLKEKTSYTPKGKTIEAMEALNRKIERAMRNVQCEKRYLDKYIERKNFLKNNIEQAPKKIKLCRQEIELFTQKLSEINNAVEPYIKKICEIYTQNGVKIIKRI